MEIQSYKKLKENQYKVTLKGHEDILLYDDIILKYNLLLTKKISEKDLEKAIQDNNVLTCYYKGIKYLSTKNRSKKEIINYLKRNQFNESDIQESIKKLEEKGYLNENTYLESYINDQINLTNNGPVTIKRKLINLGFEESVINSYLDKIEEDVWFQKLERSIPKKVNAMKTSGPNRVREKIIYQYTSDGYRKEDVVRILDNITIPKNNEYLRIETKKQINRLNKKYTGYELKNQIKIKLMNKGFLYEDINSVLDEMTKDLL